MARVELTCLVRFSAAHRYYRPDWDDGQNQKAFGDCANEHGHGHNYRCFVTISGTVSAETGMVIDLAQFDLILDSVIKQAFDHKHLNFVVPDFEYGRSIPTAENLVTLIWDRVAAKIPGEVTLTKIRLHENDDLYVEYTGRDGA